MKHLSKHWSEFWEGVAVFASVATDTDGKAESFIKRLCLYGLTKIRYYEFDFFAPVSWSKAKAFASNSFVSVLLARSGRLLLSGLLLFRLHQFLNQTADSGHCIATRKICRTSDNNIQLIHNAICIVSWTFSESCPCSAKLLQNIQMKSW